MEGRHLDFYNELKKFIPEDRIYTDELRLLTYGTDAGFYRLIPKIIVSVKNEKEASVVIELTNRFKIPITYRAAGTSLSGQAISDSVLMMTNSDWRGFSINDDASVIELDPAVIGGHANIYLAPHHKKIGPDPASINSAMISGIVSNNASGMTSGTIHNSFNTLQSARIIFNDGTVLDTGDEPSRKEFAAAHEELLNLIESLSKKVKADPQLSERIKKKFSIKNTTGYSINALLDFDDPFEILAHLMVGSEGTLGYLSKIRLKTVEDPPFKGSALIIFKDIKTACEAIPVLNAQKVDAAEIMDRAALASVENKPGMPDYLRSLGQTATALLIETSAYDKSTLDKQIEEIIISLENLEKVHPISFTTDPKEYKKLWDVRKGLFPSVCISRKPGTTVIIEDVNFPVPQLAEAVLDLQEIFKKHGYEETIIFGHSFAGNIHFVFHQDFNSKTEVLRYKNFMDEVTHLVVKKYDGSLKAEHGTGRNMAPFVKYEWGEAAYDVMREVKKILDPENLLNPGVLINDDPEIHIKNLKPMPVADELIDKCIECGFCEIKCPSKNLTTTPRQRIVAWREIARLEKTGENPQRKDILIDEYDYFGNETCATDGLCALACPVDIDTGKFIKKLRNKEAGRAAKNVATVLSQNMTLVTEAARVGLNLVKGTQNLLGNSSMQSISGSLRKISNNKIPQWNKAMPGGADSLYPNYEKENELKVVYFPSCINRAMGLEKGSSEKDSLTTKTHKVLMKAGFDIVYPENISNLCCGMAYASKGFFRQGDKKSEELYEELLRASENGKFPVLFDMSPCLYRMKEKIDELNEKYGAKISLFEPIEFTEKFLLDRLEFHKLNETVTIHTTCSSEKMGLNEKFKNVAEKCAEKVVVPLHVGCCGFAGDRGFSYPELNASALKNLKPELTENVKEGFSTSRTCEIGLTLHSGVEYKSIFYLVDKCTEVKKV